MFTVAKHKNLIVLALYCIMNFSNALFWVTFAPISDLTQTYIGGNTFGSVTAVNMLANITLILFLPGTILGTLFRKSYGMRNAILFNAALTTIGGILRIIPCIFYSQMDSGSIYMFLFFGQAFAAVAQAVFCVFPPAVANIWFKPHQRDLATTAAAMFNPIGNAVGQVFSVVFVTSDGDGKTTGMENLLGVEMGITLFSFALVYLFFYDKPDHPPSEAVVLKRSEIQNSLMSQPLINNSDSFYGSCEDPVKDNLGIMNEFNSKSEENNNSSTELLKKELKALWSNPNYIKLLILFSIYTACLNSTQSLLYQIIEPYDYTNSDAGTFGSVLIVSGLVGYVVAGFLMRKYRAYQTIFKGAVLASYFSFIFLFSMLTPNNFNALLLSFIVLGFFLMPVMVVCMELSAETTYPVAEEVSFGLTYSGGNIVGLLIVFILQQLTSMSSISSSISTFTPFNIFLIGLFTIVVILALIYNGEYKRSKMTHASEQEDDEVNNEKK